MSLPKALLRPLATVLTAVGLTVSSAPADADNTKFPAVAAEVDAGVTADSLGGGKAPSVALAGPTAPAVTDPVDEPGTFFNEVKAAAKKSWPLALLLVLVGVATALRKRVPSLRTPGTRTAAIVTGVITVGTAGIGVLTGLVSLAELLTALALAAALVISPHAKDPPTVASGN
jgi:hypothetical protein